MLVAQLCLTLCNPMDCSPPVFSVHRILQARLLEWVAIPFSRGSSWLRDPTRVSCTADRFFTVWATDTAASDSRVWIRGGVIIPLKGLPGWLSGKRICLQCWRCGLGPWVRKIPWRRKWQPTPVFLPREIPWIEEPGGLQFTGSQRSWTWLGVPCGQARDKQQCSQKTNLCCWISTGRLIKSVSTASWVGCRTNFFSGSWGQVSE